MKGALFAVAATAAGDGRGGAGGPPKSPKVPDFFFFSSPVQLGLRSWSSSLPDTIGAIKTLFTGGDQASTGQQRQIADLIAASCPTPPSLSLSGPPPTPL